MNELLERIDRLTEIGIALSVEKDTDKLLELIMMGAKALTHADGGTLYFVNDRVLTFEIISNDSLAIQMGGTSGNKIEFDPLPLYLADGSENHNIVVSHCVLTGQTVNIEDAYNEDGYDFTGARKFDESRGYKTQSILTFPLKDHEHEIIGVLQLVNAKDPVTGEVISFKAVDQQLAESLASQAAVALTQRRLMNELQELFAAFIKMIASAIDDKSPYTGGHCRRIPVLTMMLAEAVNKADEGPMKTFRIDDKDRYELETAAWLHDCGKVVTPEYVMDKSTKLETIFDRIHLIEQRFEILLRDREIEYLKNCREQEKQGLPVHELTALYEKGQNQLKNNLEFIQRLNAGDEYMTDESITRVNAIAGTQWTDMKGQLIPLLIADELLNISIRQGTLNDDEREVINHHIVATINMLESLPFPNHLKRVPEYAGGHHERMDGTGYPKGLKKDEMSVQTRIMAIADIFEALTDSDRPYKKGKKLSECLKIMSYMKKDKHIDADIYDIFVSEKVYLEYAEEFLDPEQIDKVGAITL
ncbi:MAG: GAF domain-containing protein [Gammaproteobacteria bacterium]|nr:GAF domain-containing protein [Gammaproteobacteria bacterium]